MAFTFVIAVIFCVYFYKIRTKYEQILEENKSSTNSPSENVQVDPDTEAQ